MDEKKPSTSDILAKIRAQKAAAAASAPEQPPAAEAAAPAPVVEASAPVASVPPAAATPSPVAKPGSTKDILAAIRAKGASGAAASVSPSAPAAVEPAPAPAPPSSPAAVKPATVAGPRPSVQDMLKAVREGKGAAVAAAPVAAAGAKPVIVAPPVPAKPQSAAAKKVPAPARRGMAAIVSTVGLSAACLVFGALSGSYVLMLVGSVLWMLVLSPFMAGWASLTAVGGVWTLGMARFMFPNVLVEPPSRFKVGPLSDYPLNTVSNKWKDQFGVWIVHTDQYEGQNLIFALASVCTHLGCTPSWLDGEQKFKCPCHGSGFYITGVNFEGPAPRPLERMGLKIAEGMLEVDKSVKFQEEMGQWTDPASFVAAS